MGFVDRSLPSCVQFGWASYSTFLWSPSFCSWAKNFLLTAVFSRSPLPPKNQKQCRQHLLKVSRAPLPVREKRRDLRNRAENPQTHGSLLNRSGALTFGTKS